MRTATLIVLMALCLAALAQAADPLVRKADALLRQGKPKAAVPLYQQVLKKQPESLGALYGLGRAFVMMGQGKAAVVPLEKAVGLVQAAPAEAERNRVLSLLKDWLAAAFTLDRRYDDASRTLREAIDLHPAGFKVSGPSRDVGYDVAVVRPIKVAMFKSPSLQAAPVTRVDHGEWLVLLSRKPTDGFYRGIHVGSGKEGWIEAKFASVFPSRKSRKGTVFQSAGTASGTTAEVSIRNDTDRLLSVRIGSELYTISPHARKVARVKPGTYSVYASVPQALPDMGTDTFKAGKSYRLRYYIVTRGK